jgi:hypothetical protein
MAVRGESLRRVHDRIGRIQGQSSSASHRGVLHCADDVGAPAPIAVWLERLAGCGSFFARPTMSERTPEGSRQQIWFHPQSKRGRFDFKLLIIAFTPRLASLICDAASLPAPCRSAGRGPSSP